MIVLISRFWNIESRIGKLLNNCIVPISHEFGILLVLENKQLPIPGHIFTVDRLSKNCQEEENTITFRLKCIVIA